ncbi:leucine-rich repeat domain, L domain-like protein [Artemisia annua]|uniref:Leucine-rich repeat domain, L domain-like protein n=1 Tax=Artemisia annua TaxID=35608 RepID=A0A2U1MAS0_ARTAN|nr:leucine-rich repeat domain, L domain-like protein [Artemisia annua]
MAGAPEAGQDLRFEQVSVISCTKRVFEENSGSSHSVNKKTKSVGSRNVCEFTELRMKVEPQDIIIHLDKESSTRIVDVADCSSGTIQFKKSKVSTDLMAVIEANKKQRAENLIDWSPHRVDFPPCIPSLLDLSLNGLANIADAISSLDHVPEYLRRRLTDLSCDKHTMNIHILKFLFKDSPTEICVKNCSWLSENQFVGALEKSNLQNLKVLQLENCRKCSFKEVIPIILARSSNSLAYLGILSLKGAAKISNTTLRPLLESAPLLHSINLSGCTFLTCYVVMMILDCFKTTLKELYLDDCPRIDFMFCVSALMKFEHLEVLSVARNRTVCDDFVILVTAACGKRLKELNLANCWYMTERSLQAISIFCPFLCSLNVSDVVNMSELGLCYLADGCKSLESLYIDGNCLSDEVVAAFLETSGRSLKHLSLSKIGQVSFKTAFALTKYARKLETVDLSWCTKLTEEELGFIIDNSSSLKLLKIYGCTKIAYDYRLKVTGSRMFSDTFEL